MFDEWRTAHNDQLWEERFCNMLKSHVYHYCRVVVWLWIYSAREDCCCFVVVDCVDLRCKTHCNAEKMVVNCLNNYAGIVRYHELIEDEVVRQVRQNLLKCGGKGKNKVDEKKSNSRGNNTIEYGEAG